LRLACLLDRCEPVLAHLTQLLNSLDLLLLDACLAAPGAPDLARTRYKAQQWLTRRLQFLVGLSVLILEIHYFALEGLLARIKPRIGVLERLYRLLSGSHPRVDGLSAGL